MIGIGIIGCGNIARFHYEGYANAGAKIVHACDLRTEAAEAVANRYGAQASTDYRAVLDDPAVQLVSVCTIASTHKEICLAAIAAGKGVVCEKTLSDRATDSAEIARTAEQAGVFCATAYMKRFFPALQQAKAILSDMGTLISIHARTWQPWDLWNCSVGPYLQHPSGPMRSYGGGVLVCGGSHILDLIHWYGGRASQVASQVHIREGMDIDNQANALLWLEQGGMVHFEACWHPLRFGGRAHDGWDERLEINTTKGRLDLFTVNWDTPDRYPALLIHQDAETGRVTEHHFPRVNAFHVEMASMLHWFENGETPAPSAWDGYVVDETIAHIAKSARQNAILPIVYADRVAMKS